MNYKKYQNVQWFSNFFKVKSLLLLFFILSECQNYASLNNYTRKITSSGSSYCDRESDLVGSVSRGPPVQERQLHVHRHADVAPMLPAGWMVDTLQWQTVRLAGRCVSTGLIQAAVSGQQTSKWEIVVHIMCTILVVHLLVVLSVIVALTENKVQVK